MNDLVLKREEIDAIMVMADHAFQSKYFEKLGGKSAIFILMARAKEIGMPAIEAIMGGLNIIQGKVEISPRSMNAMIRRAGHKLEILECTHLQCKLKGTRKDTGETLTVTYTIEDAKRAGIYKGAWLTYPDDMCFKSALSKLARRLWADIISTSYVEGEISGSNGESERESHPRETETIAASGEIIQAATESVKEMDKKESEVIDPNQELHIIDLLGGDEDLLKRILIGFEIENLAQLPAKKFPGTCRKITELKKTKAEAEECKL